MTNIIRPDQHLASYVFEKSVNPDTPLVWRSFEKDIVDTIDHIVELAHGDRDLVKSESDWKVVEELLKFFAKKWPMEFSEFRNSIEDIRKSRNSGGYSKSREIKYVGAIPPRFERMVRSIFPAQQWDKKFVNKFVKKFPLFKVGGEQ